MKRIYPLAFLILIFLSCEKVKNDVDKDYQSSTLIRQIGETEDQMQIFTYHNNGKIYEYLQRFGYNKYIYNDQNQLIKIEIAQSINPLSCAIIPGTTFTDGDDPRKAPVGRYVEFEYTSDNKIKRRLNYHILDGSAELLNYEEFEYENNRVKRISFFNIKNELTYYRIFEYDNNENVLSVENYYYSDVSNVTLESRQVYEYDNKHNPFQVFKVEGTPGRNTNNNNITKETYSYYYENEETLNITNFQYEYNELEYPILVNNVEYIYGKDE